MRDDLVDRIHLPIRRQAPLAAVGRRVAFALALVLFVALVTRLNQDGYEDTATGDPVSFLDALYYASVTVTTTGYGDITAIDTGARLATIFLITPARIVFLILVVGTTVEVLTDQSRHFLLTRRWRRRVNDHILICGFGATGQSAVRELLHRGIKVDDLVTVDVLPEAIDAARDLGIVAIHGDATKRSVLAEAGVDRARAVIVAPNRDDTAVLTVLTVRELNPDVHIVAGGREQENLHLLRQGGADEVIDATAAVGRMLSLGTIAPGAVEVVEDVLDSGSGLELREVAPVVDGESFGVPTGANLVVVIRDGKRLGGHQLGPDGIRATDRLVVLADAD